MFASSRCLSRRCLWLGVGAAAVCAAVAGRWFRDVPSYLLSSTLVPVLSVWLMRERSSQGERQSRLRSAYGRTLDRVLGFRWLATMGYAVVVGFCLWILLPRIGTELFPSADTNQFQIRLRAATGTRIERTEVMALRALDVIREEVGADNVAISTGFIGVQPPSYPDQYDLSVDGWPDEAVLKVALKPGGPFRGEELNERLRARFAKAMPDTAISFEAGDIISQVLSFGSPTPVEVAIQGPAMGANREHAQKVRVELVKMKFFATSKLHSRSIIRR